MRLWCSTHSILAETTITNIAMKPSFVLESIVSCAIGVRTEAQFDGKGQMQELYRPNQAEQLLRNPMRQLDLFSALQFNTEDIDTKFKSARGRMPGSFWESYFAMANTQGGTIVLGVAEKPTGLVWEGVQDAAQLRTVAGVGRQFGVAV